MACVPCGPTLERVTASCVTSEVRFLLELWLQAELWIWRWWIVSFPGPLDTLVLA